MLSLRRVALPVLLAAASLGVAAPSSADVTGTTTVPDVVLYRHCQRVPITYQLQIGPLTLPWWVEFQVADPEGNLSEGTVLNSATSPATSGTFTYQFCGSETPGTYTLLAGVRYSPVDVFSANLPSTTFQVRPPATRARLAEKSLGHGRYQLTTRVREEKEHGFGPANGVPVRLERLVSGQWKKVRGVTLTTVHGRAVARIEGHRGQRLRAVVPALDNVAGSTSGTVTL
jgi:hypothetical protein